MPKFRTDRISGEVKKEIDRIIRESIKDPRMSGTFSVTRAEVTRDLRYARIYISVLEAEKQEEVMQALKSAAGFIRRELGKSMRLRYTPELLFYADHNIEYGIHMAELLRNINSPQEKTDNA
jgi:ribosome-binding factor A